ncbi:MAG TPA: hypothetical protein VF695_11100 [Sphingomonas sp.]|jgi:hypothetical protein
MGDMNNPPVTRWYYSKTDDAEHLFGAKATREEAIEAGRAEYLGEPFWLSAGHKMLHNLDPFDSDVYCVISAFQNANADLFGEDGQGDPETEWTDEQCADLATRLNVTFAEWARQHGHDRAYMLDITSTEQVPA